MKGVTMKRNTWYALTAVAMAGLMNMAATVYATEASYYDSNEIARLSAEIEALQASSNSRLVENRSDSAAKEQLASLAFRSDSMLAVDRCSLAFWEGHVLN
jgi:hypothetical protein